MRDAPDDLAPLLEDLAETLEELRDELGPRRRGPLRNLLRFTERYTIPAVVAVLETNVRLLELTANAIRMAGGTDRDLRRKRAGRPRMGSRGAGQPGPRGLDALDAALEDFDDALRGVPTDPDARLLLAEARALSREVRARLDVEIPGANRGRAGDRSSARGAPRSGEIRSPSVGSRDRPRVSIPVEEAPADRAGDESTTGPEESGRLTGADADSGERIEVDSPGNDKTADKGVAIDVDAELESIKRDLDSSESGTAGGSSDPNRGGDEDADRGGDEDGERGEDGDADLSGSGDAGDGTNGDDDG